MAKRRKDGHIEIPWWAWLGTGIFVTVYSMVIREQTPEHGAMTLFFWIGLFIIIIGIGKVAFKKLRKEEQQEERAEQKVYSKQLHEQQLRWHQQQRAQQQQRQAPAIITCNQCQARNYANSNFCHRCGNKLR